MLPTKPSFLPPLRTLVNAYADALKLPRPPRLALVYRGGAVELRAGGAKVTGHVAAISLLVGSLVVEVAGKRVLGRPTIWKAAADLWWAQPRAMFDLSLACLARRHIDDARDLAYLALVETLYLEDVEEGEKPPPPEAVLALVEGMTSPVADESGAHLSVLRRLVARLEKAPRASQVPLLRAIGDVVADAAYANPLVLNDLVARPAMQFAMRHTDARRAAALDVVEALVGRLVLSSAYRELLPLLDVLVDAGLSSPTPAIERFVAHAALADPRAEEERVELDAWATAHRAKVRPHLAELEPWAELARAHVRAGKALLLRAAGKDPCLERPKKAIAPVSRVDAARFVVLARSHVEHARRLLGATLTTDVEATSFDASQRRKHIHEDFHVLDGSTHRAAGDARAALAAFVCAHGAALRDAYDYAKKAHVTTIRALAKKVGVPAPV